MTELLSNPYFLIGTVFGALCMSIATFIQSAFLGKGLFSKKKHIIALSEKLDGDNITAYIPHPFSQDIPGLTSPLNDNDKNVILVDSVLFFDKNGGLLNNVVPLTKSADRGRHKIRIGEHRNSYQTPLSGSKQNKEL